eukprot:15342320-Ditylum_brightwellii.AAC.1
MWKIVKCKTIDMEEGKFNPNDVLLEEDALMLWLEFKCIKTMYTNKNPDEIDTAHLDISPEVFKLRLQELKEHYLLKNLAWLQKSLPSQSQKNPNKLSIKNATAQRYDVNGMLAYFPVLGNTPMVEDELCNILCQMVKHDWCDALCKFGRTLMEMSIKDMLHSFEQIKLL